VTFNEPLETCEIENVRRTLFKIKGATLDVAHIIDPTVMQMAANMEHGCKLGVIASYRTYHHQDPQFDSPDFSYHKIPLLMQRFKSEDCDELRIYIADSCVDKVMRVDKDFPESFHRVFVDPNNPEKKFLIDSLQGDAIDQIKRHAPEGVKIVFYRFPSAEEQTPHVQQDEFYVYSNFRRQARGFDCSLFAIRDLYALNQLANEGKLWNSPSTLADPKDPHTKVVWTIPEPIMYPTQGLTLINKHPNGQALMQTLKEKNCIGPNPYAQGRTVNKYLDRFRALYTHWPMVPGDILNRSFAKSWSQYHQNEIMPRHPTATSTLEPLSVESIYQMTGERIGATP
ncbi:MAG: hypothetical protein V4492_00985, partial [Chlamydiota bacterium]